MKYIIVLLFLSLRSYAAIEIAFIELRNHEGQVIQLEPGGQFAHIAISYQGQWIHSYPFRGVEIISKENLEKIGAIKSILTVSESQDLQEEQVNRYLGKRYDSEFSWSDDKIYCSELVGKLLNMIPKPMKFKSKFWSQSSQFVKSQNGGGLSPDDIFQYLEEKYKTQRDENQCSKLFKF